MSSMLQSNILHKRSRVLVDILIVSESMKLRSIHVILCIEVVLGNATFLHGLPQFIEKNHRSVYLLLMGKISCSTINFKVN